MLGNLTDTAVKNAKAKATAYKLADGGGMYLIVTPKAQKWWRLDYRFAGKRKTISLGVYPDVSIKEARSKRDDARKVVAAGADPSQIRQQSKRAREGADTFKAVAEEWLAKFASQWAPTHTEKIEGRFKNEVFPWLGDMPVGGITAADLLRVLRRVESRGALETAHRVRQHCGQVLRYAVATGRADADPTFALRGALPAPQVRHHGSVTEPREITKLLRAIDAYTGQFVTRCALRLAPLVFVRPGEPRKAEWAEFDFEAAEWRIPAEKMKMPRPHTVPLSTQAMELLRELPPLTRNGRVLFPSVRARERPMSENTVTAALRGMGYSGSEMTAHGFRSMASTRLNEMGWHRDAIERQLAHVEGNEVRAAYNYAEHLPERRRMMQAWADYLDGLRAGVEPTPPQLAGAHRSSAR